MGVAASMLSETFPPKSAFSPDEDIPDLAGKVMIVTGGGAGIGRDTVKALLAHNAKVYIAARDEAKTARTIRELEKETGREALFLKLDLADLSSVRAAAAEFARREAALHVLFNNAGLFVPPVAQLTAQGYDLQFGVHVLGHFCLTQLLLPALRAGAASSADGTARVVTTASSASVSVSGVDFGTLRDSAARRKKGAYGLYAQSKLGNILVSNEMARRYAAEGIVSISLNPGNIKSDIQRHLSPVQRFLLNRILYDPPYGPLTQLWAGTAPETAEMNGKYLVPWARVGTPGKAARDPVLAKELWTWLEEQVAQNI